MHGKSATRKEKEREIERRTEKKRGRDSHDSHLLLALVEFDLAVERECVALQLAHILLHHAQRCRQHFGVLPARGAQHKIVQRSREKE